MLFPQVTLMLFQGTTKEDHVRFKGAVEGFLMVPDLKNTITIFITINKGESSFKFSKEEMKDERSPAQ